FQHDAYSTNTACELCESVDIAAAAVGIDSLDTSCLPACDEEDTWVCVVCGFVGCGILRSNHIQSHYEAHLHAYAMNTTTKRVWDFAGEGYVHRLILYRSDDSTNMEHNRVSSSHMKMVEVADP
ncbi:ETP1, partial [Symbiodinium microadriaticum]